MTQTFPECPGWSFTIDEVSAGVYQVTATDSDGRRLQATGTDYDALLLDALHVARELAQAAASDRR